jgi:hypothetical protein
MTPKEISDAHPKCVTCGHFNEDEDDSDSYTCTRQFMWPKRDFYCPVHTEITGEQPWPRRNQPTTIYLQENRQ